MSRSNNNTGRDNAPPAPASPFAAAGGSDTESTLIGSQGDAPVSAPASDVETIIGETDERPADDGFGGIQLYLLGTGFSEANAYMLGTNESDEDIEPFNGTDLSDVNEHLLAINSMDSGAASDAGDDGDAESSGFNELYNFMRTAESDSVLNPSPAPPTAGPSTARPSTAATWPGKRQRTGLVSLANAAPLVDGSNRGSISCLLPTALGHLLPTAPGHSLPTMPGCSAATVSPNWPEDEVVSARLSKILTHFTFAHVDVVEALYLQAYSCPLVPSDMAPVDFYRRLARAADSDAWVLWHKDADTNKLTSLQFLHRTDGNPEASCSNLLKRLGLDKDPSSVVLGPRLLFALVTIGVMSADVMTGELLGKIFVTVAGMRLDSLHVVTAHGIENLTDREVCELLKDWLESVAAYVASVEFTNGDMAAYFDLAKSCNEEYLDRCSSGAGQDVDIALELLGDSASYGRLFLGVGERELKIFYQYLPFLVGENTSTRTMDKLRLVSGVMFSEIE
ncbi:hypothetical protein IWW39_003996 [Coemansia spiralis]|uniref:Uncharacterized protein n=1 Tax=Coemansia spiralis TaxID=417178 RepID=A0A9W8L425_9FUNG|nr:hypothetical protein IWW39_003996 [Coemansia spiralis]